MEPPVKTSTVAAQPGFQPTQNQKACLTSPAAWLYVSRFEVQYLDSQTQQVHSWFQLKPVFAKQEKWLIYSRQELISHEMCHIARFHLHSHRYEETLAYKTSTSRLRKAIGGALLSPAYAIFQLIGLDFR